MNKVPESIRKELAALAAMKVSLEIIGDELKIRPQRHRRRLGDLLAATPPGLCRADGWDDTDGQVHAHQVKSLDWASRKACFVESAPDMVVQEVLDCLPSVLDD